MNPLPVRWRHGPLLLLLMAGMLACAPAPRYRVLSFFFDGVPDPDAPTTSTQVTHRRRPYALPHRPARPITVPAALPYVSQHKPYAERQCDGCHDLTSGNESMTAGMGLCDRCHEEQRVRERWSHGPINLGMCTPCHKAHESPYPHLLEEPLPALCQRCHEDSMDRIPKYHEVPELGQCTRCHDPHTSKLLEASTS